MLGIVKAITSFVKFLPILLLVSGAAYSYHNYMINHRESRINQLQTQVDQLTTENVTLREAEKRNIQTIEKLNESISTQNNRIRQLTTNNNQLLAERDQYLSIFRRHDLTQLSLARPGLIETRINRGTADVFRTLEEETKLEGISNDR